MAIQSTNPSTGKVVKIFEEWSSAQTSAALSSVAVSFNDWRNSSFLRRAECLRSLAGLLRDRVDKFAHLMALEMGKPVKSGRAEVLKAATVCDFYAENGQDMLLSESLTVDGMQAYVEYSPLGTVLAVMPWNYPVWQVIRIAAPTLMAGNTMVLKHASNVPQCALAIEEAFTDSLFPDDVFRTLLIGAGQVEDVLKHDSVIGVCLTGSEAAGRCVAKAAGVNLKKSVMELGGSDAFIVLADADLSKAAETGAQSRCSNAGQACIAAKRFIVHKDVYEPFIIKLKAEMESIKMGDPFDSETVMGPMASFQFREDIHDQVQRSISAGGKIRLGGLIPESDGAYYPPTIIQDMSFDADVSREEFFGPVALVFRAEDDDQAMEMANDSCFGLGGSVWTQDEEKGLKLARRIEAGLVYLNGRVSSRPPLPFGGIKNSGYGRELSTYGIREFVNVKSICIG
ncbi:NAD-dependent succinate-semialdehyde dehydrogenase [Maridesulfovibrio hydrothermalis]|uniref:Succinate-semialdehyde dehydrogenase [NADP+] 1 n=1 Tax=Maridesulfovibrio hydrothermalis AM13 = DSM 14728 TaxID=1121451 RepID=L0R8E1_9BACT|nr:NAD-dependent succinate-semialdehyde dehydrogenase [Maridesulfovibrio hydrothermalis]CCO23028.1 Succinate-semialdehyde dehydrogenase [NADP+] 1 [Maridesulfovibrio hydrothermalis AM13 = DSM 14728]